LFGFERVGKDGLQLAKPGICFVRLAPDSRSSAATPASLRLRLPCIYSGFTALRSAFANPLKPKGYSCKSEQKLRAAACKVRHVQSLPSPRFPE